MRKRTTISLAIVGGIVGAILLTVCICAIVANSRNDGTQPVAALCSWQDMISDDAPLKSVATPGAHDAGTKGLPYFAATQDRTVPELLECGTRYFDLRVSHSGDRLRIYHGPSKGVELADVLDGVKEFLQSHPSEAVILDFQHFENGETAQPKTLEAIEEKLSGALVENDADMPDVEFIDSLTLGKARGKALVVWGVENDEILAKGYVFKRNNDGGTRDNSVLHSYYVSSLNKKSSAKYIETALPRYIQSYKEVNSGLFVLQGQLTDGLFVFGPHFKEATHTDNMNEYVKNLETSADLSVINIVMRDFVSPEKNCLTLRLNIEKQLVKSSRLDDYAAMLNEHIKG